MDSKHDLFNNPMVESAIKSLTPEQIEEYQKIGEHMFSTDYSQEKPRSVEQDMTEAVFYIREALKAGLQPKDMSTQELQLMYEFYGSDWFRDYGYTKNEVPEAPVKKVCGVDTSKEVLNPKQLKKLEKKLKRKEFRKKNPSGNNKKLK